MTMSDAIAEQFKERDWQKQGHKFLFLFYFLLLLLLPYLPKKKIKS